jgi:D-alanyl-D-alanine carboxypeptidase/D-alanyl-D-alanine-endopeptidase (penicillin-binding protein 4)
MTSRELASIAPHIAAKVKHVACILIDNSYFNISTSMDGRSTTSNPYDAVNSAFLVNFNTVAVKVLGAGVIVSGEPETPLTEVARNRGRVLGKGSHRVNLGISVEEGGRNGAQILAYFLQRHNTTVAAPVRFGRIPQNSELLYTYRSVATLSDILASMLKHSTNVTANQIFLAIGAHKLGAPATLEKGQRVLNSFLSREVGWKSTKVEEGSGLSRSTMVTPREMMALLRWFVSHSNLLPVEEQSRVKTGTLNGVNTLVGYSTLGNGRVIRFVILVNSQVPFDYKFRVLRIMKEELSSR